VQGLRLWWLLQEEAAMSFKKIPVEDAVGMVLPHDITEIVPGEKKGPAFRKGHRIRPEDVEHLKRLGKEYIYCLELGPDDLHEDEAALRLARAVAGPNIVYDEEPREGKVGFRATEEGLLKVDRDGLFELNRLGEVMLATRHANTVVSPGDQVAAGRAIPLVIRRAVVEEVESICRKRGGLLTVIRWKVRRAAIIITGQEVYEGRIKDAFGKAMTKKLQSLGIITLSTVLCPDDPKLIAREIRTSLDRGAELVLCTGGMSVDPDDVTRLGIRMAGGEDEVYGSPVLPGAMFLVAYLDGSIPVLGIPACGIYFKTTVLDLVLPRVVAGERMTRDKIAALGHGGFCLGCKTCRYPVCPFGK